MAQDYVGSNNINLLLPNGQFGTRGQGGKDHASSRYIYTQLAPVTRFLFPKVDDILLNYLDEDGQSIEPSWYVPIIPMVLVNGSEGIGTGWSTYVPNYNPLDIIANVRHLLNDEPMETMHPWYKGFIGSIETNAMKETGTSYTVSGNIEEVDETTIRITELPIRKWTQDFKEFLESVSVDNDKSKDPFIQEFRDNSGGEIVHFLVSMSEERLPVVRQEGLLKKFKLTTSISTTNMHLFDSKGVIKKYDTPEQILEEFFYIRLEFYEKRKKIVLAILEKEMLKCDNKCRFIQCVVEGSIIVSNRKRADLFLELKAKGFTPLPKKENTAEVSVAGSTDDAEESEENSEVAIGDYDYLLSLAIGTLTLEKMQELLAERERRAREVEDLKQTSLKSLWMRDLDALEAKLVEELNKYEKKWEADRKRIHEGANAAGPTQKNARKKNQKTMKKESTVEQMEVSENTMTETDKGVEIKKPRGKAAAKKAPAAKVTVTAESDDDDVIADIGQRMAAYNLNSSPDRSEDMETEVSMQMPMMNKQPNRRGAAAKKKHPSSSITEIDDNDDDDVEIISDDDFEPEDKKKKGGRKPANGKAAKPPLAAMKKRAPAASKQSQLVGQKLITEVQKPAANSPEKKVRKMRSSPFNKKSGSILGRTISIDDEEEEDDASENSASTLGSASDAAAAAGPAVARPKRANRGKATYVLSDDSEDDNAEDLDDSAAEEEDYDFNDDDD